MLSVILDLKIEALTDEDTSSIIRKELEKDSKLFHQNCLRKAEKIISERSKLKIYVPLAS